MGIATKSSNEHKKKNPHTFLGSHTRTNGGDEKFSQWRHKAKYGTEKNEIIGMNKNITVYYLFSAYIFFLFFSTDFFK